MPAHGADAAEGGESAIPPIAPRTFSEVAAASGSSRESVAAPSSSGSPWGTWDMSDRDQKSALHRVMEDELNTVLKRKKIKEKTTPHKHEGPDAGSPLQDVGAAAADDADMASQDSDDQPLVGAASKKPSAATPMELDKGQKRSEASEP
eukprot:6122384-Pyramimonas_sp.AAC.1